MCKVCHITKKKIQWPCPDISPVFLVIQSLLQRHTSRPMKLWMSRNTGLKPYNPIYFTATVYCWLLPSCRFYNWPSGQLILIVVVFKKTIEACTLPLDFHRKLSRLSYQIMILLFKFLNLLTLSITKLKTKIRKKHGFVSSVRFFTMSWNKRTAIASKLNILNSVIKLGQ